MGTPAAAAPKAASPPKAAQTPLPDKRAPPEMLHITVQSANDLLPAAGKDTCDAFCTVRAEPLEKRNGRRTAIKHSTRDPVRAAAPTAPLSVHPCLGTDTHPAPRGARRRRSGNSRS